MQLPHAILVECNIYDSYHPHLLLSLPRLSLKNRQYSSHIFPIDHVRLVQCHVRRQDKCIASVEFRLHTTNPPFVQIVVIKRLPLRMPFQMVKESTISF